MLVYQRETNNQQQQQQQQQHQHQQQQQQQLFWILKSTPDNSWLFDALSFLRYLFGW